MMAWVVGIREVSHVEERVDGERCGSVGRFADVKTVRCRVVMIPSQAWQRLMHYRATLPTATGAGPCGTLARRPCASALAWSILNLVEPLAAYYAAYVPARRLGTKDNPVRGRRCTEEEEGAL